MIIIIYDSNWIKTKSFTVTILRWASILYIWNFSTKQLSSFLSVTHTHTHICIYIWQREKDIYIIIVKWTSYLNLTSINRNKWIETLKHIGTKKWTQNSYTKTESTKIQRKKIDTLLLFYCQNWFLSLVIDDDRKEDFFSWLQRVKMNCSIFIRFS